jgi:hypothetical protein
MILTPNIIAALILRPLVLDKNLSCSLNIKSVFGPAFRASGTF